MKNSRFRHLLKSIFLIGLWGSLGQPTTACTRAVYTGSEDVVITGRTMDWCEDMQPNLWAFPRGIKRDGAAGVNSVNWISKFGSVVVSSYEAGTADGMNEKGVVANLLYLVESSYGSPDQGKKQLSIALWAQYVLDNFDSVNDAVAKLEAEPFQIVAPVLPNGAPAKLHLAISDSTGDSAIFEYIAGKLVIHHGKKYQVMTNSPNFDDQLALNKYWQNIGGLTFLPGTNRASDRFARTSFLINAIPKSTDSRYIKAVPNGSYTNQAVASVMSVMRSVSVPLGINTPGQPNISSTIWRTVADHKHRTYFFDSATSPNTFWITLSSLDFSEGSPIKKLDLAMNRFYAGNVISAFQNSDSFKFLPMQAKK